MEREYVEFEAERFNQFVHDKKSLYNLLVEEYGWHLPPLKCQAVTVKYLLGVANDEIFCYKKENVKVPPKRFFKHITRLDLYYQLQMSFQGELGYGPRNLPTKQYLAEMLYTTNEDDKLFKQKNMITKVKITKK